MASRRANDFRSSLKRMKSQRRSRFDRVSFKALRFYRNLQSKRETRNRLYWACSSCSFSLASVLGLGVATRQAKSARHVPSAIDFL